MQWILQEIEDNHKLAGALDRLGIAYTMHQVVPFIGAVIPEPVVADRDAVVLFGSYSIWRYAEAHGLRPGVFRVEPFVHREAWHPHLLNGPDALFLTLRDVPDRLPDDGRELFVRPVSDNKEEAGRVKRTGEIIASARRVLALGEEEIPEGSMRHDTRLMFTKPADILAEWRLWIVEDEIVTWSLYKEGARVVYRHEVDADALAFARRMVDLAPGYARAYVLDVCRTAEGLRLLETNCLNAAGFYAADLDALAKRIDGLDGS